MRFETTFEQKLQDMPKELRWIYALLLVLELMVNTFMPFVLGFYFAKTGSLIILALFTFNILFNLDIEFIEGRFHLKIVRGF